MSSAVTGRIPLDDNRNPVLGGLSNADGQTVLPGYIDSSTNSLLVKVTSGGGGGTQYVEGVTTSPGTGTLALGRYVATPPLLTDGKLYGLQLDSSGRLLTNPAPLTGANDSVAINDGTNGIVATLAQGVPVSTGNSLLTASASWYPTAFSVTSVTTGTIYDVGNYRWVSIQINSQYTGSTPTITFQVSNDNSNWFSQNLAGSASSTGSSNSTTTTGIWHGPISARYFRLNFTGTYSSGTAAGQIVFSTMPSAMSAIGVSASLNAGSNTIGSINLAAATTGGYSFSHQSANGTTTVKSGAGTLHTVTINNAGTTDTVTIYDNTAGSGTVIAIIGSSSEATFTYDVAFATGLTAVIAGTTAPDVTFTYK